MTLASAWSAAASPIGRYGVATNMFIRSCLATATRFRSSAVAVPDPAASSSAARSAASRAASQRSRSPGDREYSSSTAAVLTADASHQPARREGSVPTPPADATGSTYASRQAVTPDAALGPAEPAKYTANATGTVAIVASQAEPLTTVPMISVALPAIASPRWLSALSRLEPP